MNAAFSQELLIIERRVLEMSGLVEQEFARTMHALRDQDAVLALRIARDTSIGEVYRQTRSRLLAVMACYAPVAHDLRFLLCAQVVMVELQHISEQVLAIVQQILRLKRGKQGKQGVAYPPSLGNSQDVIGVLFDAAQRLGPLLPMSAQSLIAMDIHQAGTTKHAAQRVILCLQHITLDEDERVLAHTDERQTDGDDGAQLHGAQRHLALVAQRLETIGTCVRRICDDVEFMVAGDVA